MSRSLNGSGQYLRRSSFTQFPAAPFTIAGWFNATNHSNHYSVMSFGNSTANYYGDGQYRTTQVLREQLGDIFNVSNCISSNTGTDAAWQHMAIVISGSTAANQRVVLNGDWASSATGSDGINFSGIDLFTLGNLFWFGGGPYNDFNGLVAQWALWSSALSQANVESLAGTFSSGVQSGSGANPQAISAGTLLAYWPIVGTTSPEPDIINSYNLTLTGSPTQGASDPVIDAYGASGLSAFGSAASAGGGIGLSSLGAGG